jgi:hypothetical protein
MKRYFFFALLFPPAFMNLTLIQAHPASLPYYFIASYVIATIPALLIALTDEALRPRTLSSRAVWCALAGFVATPIPMWFVQSEAGVWPLLQSGCFGALAAFFCTVAFSRFDAKARLSWRVLERLVPRKSAV